MVRCDRVGALIEAPFVSMRVTHDIARRDLGDASLGALRQARWKVAAVALVALASSRQLHTRGAPSAVY